MKCYLLKIKKSDLTLVNNVQTKFDTSNSDDKSFIINHDEDFYGFGEWSIPFTLSISDKNVPVITDISFDIAIRTKIDLAENHANETISTNVGKNTLAYGYTNKSPKINYQQSNLFIELKGKNG